MIWRYNCLHKLRKSCLLNWKWRSTRLVVVFVLRGKDRPQGGGIHGRMSDLGNDWVVLRKVLRILEFLGTMESSGRLSDLSKCWVVLREDTLLACLVVYLGRSWWGGTHIVLCVDQNLTTTMPPLLPPSPSSREKEWSGLISLLAWEVVASFVLWRGAVKMPFRILSFESWSRWGQLVN